MAGTVSAQHVAADGAAQTFGYLSEQYFEQVYFKYQPTAGTQTGFHQYDAQLEDYSAANVKARVWRCMCGRRRLRRSMRMRSMLAQAADRDILLNSIRSWELSLEVIKPLEKNPSAYVEWCDECDFCADGAAVCAGEYAAAVGGGAREADSGDADAGAGRT